MSGIVEKTCKKQTLHDTLGSMVAELEAAKNSLQEVKDCTKHAKMQSNQIGMSSFSSWINASERGNVSFFSLPYGLSGCVTQIMNLKIKKFGIFIFTSKDVGKNRKSPTEIVLTSIFA